MVIAHRLSTIQHAHRILVFHKGRLREQGSHQELLALRGIYYRLYQLQYKEQEIRPAGAGRRLSGRIFRSLCQPMTDACRRRLPTLEVLETSFCSLRFPANLRVLRHERACRF